MKKVLVIGGVLVGLLVAGVAMFLATFNADRYRPLVIKQLESALGKPVQLAHLSLEWRGGIALELKGFAIYPTAQAMTEPTVQVETLSAVVRLLPLLKKEVQVSSIALIRPRVQVRRDAQGNIDLMGLAVVAGPAAASSRHTTRVGGVPASLNITSLQVEDGSLHWTDAMASPPVDLWVTSLDATLKHVSLTGPIEFQLRLAATFAGGTIDATGTMEQLKTQPRATLQITIDKLALDALLPTPGPDEPQLRGRLSASFHGTGQGLAIPQLTQTLSGQGHLAISEGVIANLNVLREVFRRLSILPGLVETLQARLPESYQAKLAARDTVVLQPIEVSVTARNGALVFDHLRVATDSFELHGAGRVGFDGTFMCQSMLQIDPALSAAIIKSVKELQPLTDTGGRLELPVVIQGNLPRVAVLPDVQDVASRLVATKAEELLGNLLEKVLEKQGGSSVEE